MYSYIRNDVKECGLSFGEIIFLQMTFKMNFKTNEYV